MGRVGQLHTRDLPVPTRCRDSGRTELQRRYGPRRIARHYRSAFVGFGHSVSDAALVGDPSGAGRIVAELGHDLLDEGAQAIGVGGLAVVSGLTR